MRYLSAFARAIPITPASSLLLEQLHFLFDVLLSAIEERAGRERAK